MWLANNCTCNCNGLLVFDRYTGHMIFRHRFLSACVDLLSTEYPAAPGFWGRGEVLQTHLRLKWASIPSKGCSRRPYCISRINLLVFNFLSVCQLLLQLWAEAFILKLESKEKQRVMKDFFAFRYCLFFKSKYLHFLFFFCLESIKFKMELSLNVLWFLFTSCALFLIL